MYVTDVINSTNDADGALRRASLGRADLSRGADEALPAFRQRIEAIRLAQGPGIPMAQRLLVSDVDRIMQDAERRCSVRDSGADDTDDAGASMSTTDDGEPEVITGSRSEAAAFAARRRERAKATAQDADHGEIETVTGERALRNVHGN